MHDKILSVPEENLREVIAVIRAGLSSMWEELSEETKDALTAWCKEEEEYLGKLEE